MGSRDGEGLEVLWLFANTIHERTLVARLA